MTTNVTDVEVVSGRTSAMAQQPPAELTTNFLELIARAASDPNVDVAKMERLLEMQFKLLGRAAEASFNQAIARLQPKIPRITKNGGIVLKDGSVIAYAKYDDICDVVLPLLAEEGLTVSYSSDLVETPNGNKLKITATFRHIEGHHDSGSVFLPTIDDTGAKNAVQGAGSIYSYGKRYALCQYLNIVTEGDDDDGMQGLLKPISEKQQHEIYDLIADSKCDEGAFLKFMGVDSVKEITVKDFLKAKTSLIQKRDARKKS